MAGLYDVLNAMAALAVAALYPAGTGQPSVTGRTVSVYPGWPLPDRLDADLAAGAAHVSVYPPGGSRNTTRYRPEAVELGLNPHTLTLQPAAMGGLPIGQAVIGTSLIVAGTALNKLRVGGTVTVPQTVTAIVEKRAYAYAVRAGDGLESVAEGLAQAIAAGVPGGPGIPGTVAVGREVVLPPGHGYDAYRVGTGSPTVTALRQQEERVSLVVWASTPAQRGRIADALDVAFADTPFLALADQTAARCRFAGRHLDDGQQLRRLYREDLMFTVDYSTTQQDFAHEIASVGIGSKAPPDIGADADFSIRIDV
ncbi:hypothetical protein SAMN02949497_3421 [Methylomagnum ishizawai]|uniref:Uncharacterized protein n=1 Tax=Methylomagnum ishizawai TaxID=1760988 RepID=A0A1Y6D0C2_9GAMM|nr:hypothetical protein [Methylomagnum ishizawai]SMF96041.1 hypothetical protein SAMN02949497_3421 [Methylomagnum ishizawai]